MSVPTKYALASLFAPLASTGHASFANGLMASFRAASSSTGTTDRNNRNGLSGKWSLKNMLKNHATLAYTALGGHTKNNQHVGLHTTYHRPARGMFVSRHAPRSPPVNAAN